jgi:hypothetical protein
MMKVGKLKKVGCVVALAAIPFYAHASPSEAGMKACAEAMVNDLAEKQGKPMVYNLSPESDSGPAWLGSREVFHLDAYSPDGEVVLSRMDCVVNRNGQVRKLIAVPLDGEDAHARATTFN